MPRAAPKACPYCGKAGCTEHKKPPWQKPWEGAGKGRGGRAWRRLREQVLERDGYLCKPCLRNERITRATEVDHIISKADGGTDDMENLQSICSPCHKAKTARERTAGRVKSL